MISYLIASVWLLCISTTYLKSQQAMPSQPIPMATPPLQQLPAPQAAPMPPSNQPQQAATPQAKTAKPVAERPAEEIGTSGNWMKKREWLLKSNEVNTDIQNAAAESEGIQKEFMTKYKEIDDILDNFYQAQGLEQGKIEELFESINRFLETKKKRELSSLNAEATDPQLQGKIEVIEAKIDSYRQQLEQLRLDMQSIEDLDRSLTDRLKRLDQHLEKIDTDADKAEKIIEDLWHIIDDTKARDKYYELKNTLLVDINNSKAYLENDLLSDFEAVIETINNQISRVKDELDAIESKGFIIKDRARRVEELKFKELQEIDKAQKEKEAQEKLLQKQPVQKKIVIKPWYSRIYDHFIALLSSGYRSSMWLLSSIGLGEKKEATTPKA